MTAGRHRRRDSPRVDEESWERALAAAYALAAQDEYSLAVSARRALQRVQDAYGTERVRNQSVRKGGKTYRHELGEHRVTLTLAIPAGGELVPIAEPDRFPIQGDLGRGWR